MFSLKDPSEQITVTFDFTALTATVSSPTVTASVNSGTPDAAPSALLSGAAQVSGAKVLQTIIGGQSGTSYELRCQITASDGSKYVLADVLPVISV